MDGAELRARREAAGLSPRQLARLVGVRPRTIDRWERGEGRISRIRLVERALGAAEIRHAPVLEIVSPYRVEATAEEPDAEAAMGDGTDEPATDDAEPRRRAGRYRRVYVPPWLIAGLAALGGLIVWARTARTLGKG